MNQSRLDDRHQHDPLPRRPLGQDRQPEPSRDEVEQPVQVRAVVPGRRPEAVRESVTETIRAGDKTVPVTGVTVTVAVRVPS